MCILDLTPCRCPNAPSHIIENGTFEADGGDGPDRTQWDGLKDAGLGVVSSFREEEEWSTEKGQIVKHLEKWAEEEILPMLKPVEKSWQAQDFLPEAGGERFIEEVRELRARAAGLPDEYLVCLVGDTITEEALPTYQTMLNSFVGRSAVSDDKESAWATWVRGWTAEENRHGDLL